MTTLLRGVHHIAIRARDFEKSLAFYAALGMQPTMTWGEGDGRAAMLDAGNGTAVELFAGGPETPKPEGAWTHLAFRVDDCDAAFNAAVAAGATVTLAPKEMTIPAVPTPLHVRLAFVLGPDGEVLEFFQPK